MLTTMALAPGDIVILGSDGLWDNVSEEELLEEVEKDVLEGGWVVGWVGSAWVGVCLVVRLLLLLLSGCGGSCKGEGCCLGAVC